MHQRVQQNLNLTNLYVETKNSVLLQTAKGYISAPSDSANVALARLLFDGGSERSFVSFTGSSCCFFHWQFLLLAKKHLL